MLLGSRPPFPVVDSIQLALIVLLTRRHMMWWWSTRAVTHAAMRWQSRPASARCCTACGWCLHWQMRWQTAPVGTCCVLSDHVGLNKMAEGQTCYCSVTLLCMQHGPPARPSAACVYSSLRREHRLHSTGGRRAAGACFHAPAADALPSCNSSPAAAAAQLAAPCRRSSSRGSSGSSRGSSGSSRGSRGDCKQQPP